MSARCVLSDGAFIIERVNTSILYIRIDNTHDNNYYKNQQYINNVLAEEKRPGLCSAGCRVAASPLQSSLQRRTPVHCVIPEEEEKGGGEGMRRRKDEEEGGGGRRRRKEEEKGGGAGPLFDHGKGKRRNALVCGKRGKETE